MTVKELKEALSAYPDDMVVMYREQHDENDANFWEDADYYPISIDIHTPYDLNCNRLDTILYIDKE